MSVFVPGTVLSVDARRWLEEHMPAGSTSTLEVLSPKAISLPVRMTSGVRSVILTIMDPSGHDTPAEVIPVAEAKRRFSELIDRVQNGDRVLISRRGKPVMAFVPPDVGPGTAPRPAPLGLAAMAGALANWDDLEDVVQEIYAQRKRAKDREVPALEDLGGTGAATTGGAPSARQPPAARSLSGKTGKGARRPPKRRARPERR